MSYSVNSPCWNCSKETTCTDREKIGEAVNQIHNEPAGLGDGNPHGGSGMIVLYCTNIIRKDLPIEPHH